MGGSATTASWTSEPSGTTETAVGCSVMTGAPPPTVRLRISAAAFGPVDGHADVQAAVLVEVGEGHAERPGGCGRTGVRDWDGERGREVTGARLHGTPAPGAAEAGRG